MWPLGYPERAPHEVHGETYDYVIIGGEKMLYMRTPQSQCGSAN